MNARRQRGQIVARILYFLLLCLLLVLLCVHAFRIYPLETGFFTQYLVALVFVMMLLPLVPKIKIFDIVDIKRETRMFNTNAKAGKAYRKK